MPDPQPKFKVGDLVEIRGDIELNGIRLRVSSVGVVRRIVAPNAFLYDLTPITGYREGSVSVLEHNLRLVNEQKRVSVRKQAVLDCKEWLRQFSYTEYDHHTPHHIVQIMIRRIEEEVK